MTPSHIRYASKIAGNSRPPLMYAWHGKEYFAVAHGISGILMLLLMQPQLLAGITLALFLFWLSSMLSSFFKTGRKKGSRGIHSWKKRSIGSSPQSSPVAIIPPASTGRVTVLYSGAMVSSILNQVQMIPSFSPCSFYIRCTGHRSTLASSL